MEWQTAEEARKKTNEYLSDDNYSELEVVFDEIEEAVDNRKFETVLSGSFMKETMKKLEELGYVLELFNDGNEDSMRISWVEKKDK